VNLPKVEVLNRCARNVGLAGVKMRRLYGALFESSARAELLRNRRGFF
jgi:hypothetical protein